MKSYKIDKTRNIGNVVFVVEGGRLTTSGTELRLLKCIFADILGYEVQELRRGSDEFIGHGSHPHCKVFALNLPKNQLTQLTEDSLDELYSCLNNEFKIKPENCQIYFLYDRDYKSYTHADLRINYIQKYTDPFGTEEGDQGQLLLSYPAVESYLLSCFQNDVYLKSFLLGKDVKPEVEKAGITVEMINAEEHLIHATEEMDKGLYAFGIVDYDLDNLGSTLLKVFDAQQNKYANDQNFSLLSLVSMALLELGVIVEYEENEDTDS